MARYRRVLVKLSGGAFSGPAEFGFDKVAVNQSRAWGRVNTRPVMHRARPRRAAGSRGTFASSIGEPSRSRAVQLADQRQTAWLQRRPHTDVR